MEDERSFGEAAAVSPSSEMNPKNCAMEFEAAVESQPAPLLLAPTGSGISRRIPTGKPQASRRGAPGGGAKVERIGPESFR